MEDSASFFISSSPLFGLVSSYLVPFIPSGKEKWKKGIGIVGVFSYLFGGLIIGYLFFPFSLGFLLFLVLFLVYILPIHSSDNSDKDKRENGNKLSKVN